MTVDLTMTEKTVLVGLVRHLVLIDGELSDSELYDLIRLGTEIGRDDFEAALEATEQTHTDRDAMIEAAASIERTQARDKIRSELGRIAEGDGLHRRESAFIQDVVGTWEPAGR